MQASLPDRPIGADLVASMASMVEDAGGVFAAMGDVVLQAADETERLETESSFACIPFSMCLTSSRRVLRRPNLYALATASNAPGAILYRPTCILLRVPVL